MSESLIEDATQIATELAKEHKDDIKYAVSYVTYHERRYIQEAFLYFEQHYNVSVQSLNNALEKINRVILKCSRLTPSIEKLVKFNMPYASDKRPLITVEDIRHVKLARLQAIRYVIDGHLAQAKDTIRFTASIIAKLAYRLCC